MANNNLKKIIEDLKKTYLDCSICPPNRNCCNNFSENFDHIFSIDTVKKLFSPKIIELMLEKKQIKRYNDSYRIIKGRCPVLDNKLQCTKHSILEQINAQGCIAFPIYITNRLNVKYDENGEDFNITKYGLDLVLIDYRCFSVEQNWIALNKELSIIHNNLANIFIASKQKSDTLEIYPILLFNKLLKEEKIPIQNL